MSDRQTPIHEFTTNRNGSKALFTAGPASLLTENITGLRPCFGRGDDDYQAVEEHVLEALLELSGHQQIARMQGSASLALEVMSLNFLYGRVLVIDTGYYSDRMLWLAESAKRRYGYVKEVVYVSWKEIDGLTKSFDWVVACPTETSCGLKISIQSLERVAQESGARLMLDATASIGLEEGHELADVIAYSSCKGLFGLTGAAFIAFNETPSQQIDSFYLSLQTHLEKRMTGPYHAIASLSDVLPSHDEFRSAVVVNKERFCRDMNKYLVYPESRQPLLCTYADCRIMASDPKAILYHPRSSLAGSVVCHLGEVHLGAEARGEILNLISVDNSSSRG